MRRMQTRMTATLVAVATIGLGVSPWRALAASPSVRVSTHASRNHRRALATPAVAPTTRTSGGDDGGSDDGGSGDAVTTRTSPVKPVGGVGPLLGGSGASATGTSHATTHGHHAHAQPHRSQNDN